MKNDVKTIFRKDYPITVLKYKVCDLDINKCSKKFIDLGLNDEDYVYVKCDGFGNIEFRGKKKEYRLYDVKHVWKKH